MTVEQGLGLIIVISACALIINITLERICKVLEQIKEILERR